MINANTKLFAVIGHPIKHSLSPNIHNAAFKEKRINAVYLAFDINDLQGFVDSMRLLNIHGVSVTIPHKIGVMKYIDEIDNVAKAIGSVNTLYNIQGRIKGFNTDGFGSLKALQEATTLKDKKIIIFGTGGVSRAISFTLISEGNIRELSLIGIDDKQGKELALDLNTFIKNENKKVLVNYININKIDIDFVHRNNILINCSPVGMYPKVDNSVLSKEFFINSHVVFDVVYNPRKTKFLKFAENKGAKIIFGYRMFLFQAVMQFELWFNMSAPIKVMEKIILENL